jgi:phospholipid/cholesterol/gamma-HCH transport system permease protein
MSAAKKSSALWELPFDALQKVGSEALDALQFLGSYGCFVGSVTRRIVTPPWRSKLILDQAVLIGVKSFPIAALTSIFVGMVMVLQTGVQLTKFGAKSYVPGISFIANAREFVPAFCSMVVGARVAASITAEIGSMRVTEQLDAMDILNVDPVRYLCAPRVIAMTLTLPMISCICLITGYLGGQWIGANFLNIDPLQYFSTTLAFAKMPDIIGGVIKTIVFGYLIAMTGCYYGFNTMGGAAGVGRATTNSVVFALILILFFDYLLTSIILSVTGM